MSYKNCKCKAGQCPPVPEGRDALVRQRYAFTKFSPTIQGKPSITQGSKS